MFPEADGRWRTVLTKVIEPTGYFVRAYRARSAAYHLGVITVPRIESAKLRIVQPAYARRPPYEGPLPKDGVSGLRGTKVEVILTSNRPLGGGARSACGAAVRDAPRGVAAEVPRDARTTSRPAVLPMKPAEPGSQEVSGEFADRRRREVRVPRDRRSRPGVAADVFGQRDPAGRRAAAGAAHPAAEDVAGHALGRAAGGVVGGGRLRDFPAAIVPQPERFPAAAGRSAAGAAAAAAAGRAGAIAAGPVRAGAGRRNQALRPRRGQRPRRAKGRKARWPWCGSSARRSSSGCCKRRRASSRCSRSTTTPSGGWNGSATKWKGCGRRPRSGRPARRPTTSFAASFAGCGRCSARRPRRCARPPGASCPSIWTSRSRRNWSGSPRPPRRWPTSWSSSNGSGN